MATIHNPISFSSIWENIQNVVANHRIVVPPHNLAELNIESRRLAQSYDGIASDHAAQLFFAQRGIDFSKYLQHVLTTQSRQTSVEWKSSITFDVDEYTINQQDTLLSNIINQSIEYDSISTTKTFTDQLQRDWAHTKQLLIESMNFSLTLDDDDDAENDPERQSTDTESDISSLAGLPKLFKIGSLLTPKTFTSLSRVQVAYAEAFKDIQHSLAGAVAQRDTSGVCEILLNIPFTLQDVSTQLADANISNQHYTREYDDQQMSDCWMLLSHIANIITQRHLSVQEQHPDGNLLTVYQQHQQQTKQHGNAFVSKYLLTKPEHGVLGALSYLQQLFCEHMTSVVLADPDLSAEYNNTIQAISDTNSDDDDNILMLELVDVYIRSRDFRSRFLHRKAGRQDHQRINTNQSFIGDDNSSFNLSNYGGSSHNTSKFLATTTPQSAASASINTDVTFNNIWSNVFCCVRCGDYQTAAYLLEEVLNSPGEGMRQLNASTLHQVLVLYADHYQHPQNALLPVNIPNNLWHELWEEMRAVGAAGATASTTATSTQRGAVFSNPFRKCIYSVLGHFPIHPTEMSQSIEQYVLLKVEDYFWYRLRLIAHYQHIPSWLLNEFQTMSAHHDPSSMYLSGTVARPSSYMDHTSSSTTTTGEGYYASSSSSTSGSTSTSSSSRPLPTMLSLQSLQAGIAAQGASYFTKSSGNVLIYPFILLLSQQYESAIIELFKYNPSYGIHLAIACALLGLVHVAPATSDVVVSYPVSYTSPSGGERTNAYAINISKVINSFASAVAPCNGDYARCYEYLADMLYSNDPFPL